MRLPKVFLLILGLFTLSLLGLSFYQAAAAPLPENFPSPPPAGQIEVKQYPAYRAGTYSYTGQLDQAAEVAFQPLFRHIQANKIGMTAPVETRYPLLTFEQGATGSPDQVGQAQSSTAIKISVPKMWLPASLWPITHPSKFSVLACGERIPSAVTGMDWSN